MTSDLDEQLTRLLAEPTRLDADPELLSRILSRRGRLVRRRRLVLTAGALAAVSVLTVSAVGVSANVMTTARAFPRPAADSASLRPASP